MKKRFLLIGSLAFCQFMAKAQTKPVSDPPVPSKTDIELVYNHYLQNGSNSAVTGGIGTEKLVVYGPALNLKRSRGKKEWSLKTGVDIITSASTDNIDFVLSSASRTDKRVYFNPGFTHKNEQKQSAWSGGLGFSMESDYLSLSAQAGFQKESTDKMRSFTAQFQFFQDDLRWGRVNPDYYRPVRLIVPVELRYRSWYEEYLRRSYNFKFSLSQIANRRNTVGIFPELTIQKGLLATPFHRIYFKEDSLAVEQLPNERWKLSMAIKWNRFLGGRVILRNTLQFYSDNFGIRSITFENETAVKISPSLTLTPQIRIAIQQGSRYFAGYKEHESTEQFYTSDYDLSTFRNLSAGGSILYRPSENLSRKLWIQSLKLRYQYNHRSNNLVGHIFSLVIGLQNEKK